MSITSWRLSRERNNKIKRAKFRPHESLIQECLLTTELAYKEGKYKGDHKNRDEDMTMLQWNALTMFIHD